MTNDARCTRTPYVEDADNGTYAIRLQMTSTSAMTSVEASDVKDANVNHHELLAKENVAR